ncbi:hypothetical protein RYX36_007418, partial [Vicia faba]
MRVHTLDPKDFKESNFFETLEELKISNFFCTPPKRIYMTLVKIFFSNLHLTNIILHSEVRKHRINLSIEEFGKLLDLSHKYHLTKTEEKIK